jgi:hypothetical protein
MSEWWKCKRCKFDASTAAKRTDGMDFAARGDLAASIMQSHMLGHVCDLLADKRELAAVLREGVCEHPDEARAALIVGHGIVCARCGHVLTSEELRQPVGAST